jgi:Cu-Zn family superoxide dismutase
MVGGMSRASIGAVLFLGLQTTGSSADQVRVEVHLISPLGVGEKIGTISLEDAQHGLTITPKLTKLPPGKHAFHIHENPDCGAGMENGRMVAGSKAGGHFDPFGQAHDVVHHRPRGDLPELAAEADGTAVAPVASDTLTVAAVRDRAIMLHLYGEDEPGKAKGGGPRFACGVIPK